MTIKLILEDAYTPTLEEVISALQTGVVSSEQLTSVMTPPRLWSPTGEILMWI